MSAYDEILKLLKTEVRERHKIMNLLDKDQSEALFTAYLVFEHGARILKFALAAIRKEQDERQ